MRTAEPLRSSTPEASTATWVPFTVTLPGLTVTVLPNPDIVTPALLASTVNLPSGEVSLVGSATQVNPSQRFSQSNSSDFVSTRTTSPVFFE